MSTPAPSPRSVPRTARWAAPVAVVALIAGGALVRTSAEAANGLPERTAAQLLASLQTAGDTPFAGTVTKTARLGLPALPGGNTSLESLVAGTHTARVWYAGPTKTRVAVIGDLAETDVIRNGRDVWIWSSGKNTAQHSSLPDEKARTTAATPTATALTPTEAAAQALAAIDPTTTVSVSGTSRVAGRSAYELVLRPKDTATLIGQVRLAVDSETSTPLRVQVYDRSATAPAFETRFTSIDFGAPAADVFAFTPPPGAKVSELGAADAKKNKVQKSDKATRAGASTTSVVGSGWTSVVVLRTPVAPNAGEKKAGENSSSSLSTLMRATKPVSGAFGTGRMLQTKLVTVLLLDDGRTLIGAVTPAAIQAAAADPAAALVPTK